MTKDIKLDGSEIYVVARLMNDMEIMAILKGEDAKYVKLEYPMEVRMMPELDEKGRRKFTKFAAMPLTQLSDDPQYIIDKGHILFIKKLSKDMIQHYRAIIVNPEESADLEWDEWEGIEEDPVDEAMEKLMESKKTYH